MSRPVAIRLAFAGGLALVMAVLIVVLLSVSGSKSTSASPPDPECLANWNNDVGAVYVGQHLATAHRYSRVEVLRLADDGGELGPGQTGRCAVAFAAPGLDPEPQAAAQIYDKGRVWRAVSSLPAGTPERRAALQREASEKANATISADGKLAPL